MRGALAAAALLMARPAFAGDPVGLDPAIHDRCLANAKSEGAVVDCAGQGVTACLAFWKERDPSRDPFIVRDVCTDAEHQLWEASLTTAYDALIASTKVSRPEAVADIREMERAWLAFRDARCKAEVGLFGHGTGGAIAEPECLMHETARQTALLRELGKG
ncbi:DUF1311 domain-containing protein [Paracoccus suum]|uniref:DUF1311 domain-containing protein n=1 Tax=Paracoccus suum TaxID=2259340 RepID=A0A344PM87_9RHOB|nr:lysozyme inhibitor LprI family protein [Paracoccus suum]AXC50492.1 DUF1311 domain-containing protein [Paracoccus suum]